MLCSVERRAQPTAWRGAVSGWTSPQSSGRKFLPEICVKKVRISNTKKNFFQQAPNLLEFAPPAASRSLSGVPSTRGVPDLGGFVPVRSSQTEEGMGVRSCACLLFWLFDPGHLRPVIIKPVGQIFEISNSNPIRRKRGKCRAVPLTPEEQGSEDLVAPYRAIMRYYRCDTPYHAIPL